MFGSIMRPFLLILLLIATPFIFRLGARGAIGFANNSAYETVTGHSITYVAPYNVKNELHKLRMECNIRGTAWCNRNYKKAVASIYSEAKQQEANK